MKLSDLKNRLQQLNNKSGKSDLWKPKDEHDVRCLRDPHSKEQLRELYFHYDIGGQGESAILCPKMNFGEDCDICAFAEKLKAWKDENGEDKSETTRKQDFEVFKKIQAKAKVFQPVVERKEPGKDDLKEETAKWWGMTPNQSLQVVELCTSAERLAACEIDPMDEEKAIDVIIGEKKAFDLHVSFRKPGQKGNTKSFTEVLITGCITPRPTLKDTKKLKDLLATIKPLSEVYPKVPSEEVKKRLEAFMNAEQPEAKPEGGKEYNTVGTNSTEKAERKGRSIDEAFGDMKDKTTSTVA